MEDHKSKSGDSCCGGMGGGACDGGGCRCPHHKMPALMVLLIAVAFLLGSLGVLAMNVVGIVWPILLGVGALTKLAGGKCKCC